jgi:hypothetical protein
MMAMVMMEAPALATLRGGIGGGEGGDTEGGDGGKCDDGFTEHH